MTAKPAISFAEAFPKPEPEKDRYELRPGIDFTITGIVISTQTRFDKVAKINGEKDGDPVKYYTTAKVIVRQCEDMLNKYGPGPILRQPLNVHVAERISGKGLSYMEFE